MIVRNKVLEESFDYRNNSHGSSIAECVVSIDEVYLYVSNVGERLYFDSEGIYSREIKEGISLADWLWANPQDGNEKEYKDMLAQVLTKPAAKDEDVIDHVIDICFYPDGIHASTREQYVAKRREILAKIADKGEFCELMPSCFVDSVFSTQVKNGLNSISSFGINTVEIVKNLSVLNDDAFSVYQEHKSNLSEAYKILSSKLLECSPDAKNVQHLKFEFIDDDGNRINVQCSPHLKLIREDSDLRIYFYWCHDNIGDGKKILIGRIGTHPY